MSSHFPSMSNTIDINPMVHMLTEDIRLAVMPIGGRTKRSHFSVDIKGGDDAKREASELCGSIARFDRHDHTALICDTVEQITSHIAWHGDAHYEIMNTESFFCLNYITPHRLYKIPRYYIQWIPKADHRYFAKRFVILPSKDIWRISIPKVLGGKKKYRRMIKQLRKFDHLKPSFMKRDFSAYENTPGFNFQDYVLNVETHYSRITSKWGWNRRDYSQRNNTEFFSFYRIITFRWAQAIIREHIIHELNCLLSSLDSEARITVKGLPKSEEIMNVRKQLQDGNIDFDQASDLVSI